MPIYTLTVQEGLLSEDRKRAIAETITDIHVAATGGPKSFVHVLFHVYPKGDAFVGGAVSSPIVLLCQIRAGRDITKKQAIVKQCFDAILRGSGIPEGQILVVLQDVAASQGMAHGAILPEPIPEQEAEWLQAHAK